MEIVKLSDKHGDIVTDISFDFYGTRFATCSIDKSIKVWTKLNKSNGDQNDDTWIPYTIQRTHQDSIWRVSWSHPEFGQLIASCSEDRTVCIWEEQESVANSSIDTSKERWIKKATLQDSKRAVNDVKFAPRHLGLKVATASADGLVRIYEATDIFSLTFWQMQAYFRVEDTTTILDNQEKTIDGSIISEHGLTCLSWNDSQFELPRLAVGGYSKRAVVWVLKNGKWIEECLLGSHGNTVHDIAWAPYMGRSYHLIATASRESTFQIHMLSRKDSDLLEYVSSVTITSPNESSIWRLSWNATGTVLGTSSEDGTLALWRRDFSGKWINIQSMSADSTQFRSFYSNNN